MDYKEFEKLVITGHDIEFEYGSKRYSIIKAPDGYTFTEINNKETENKYSSILQLLINVKINNKHLKEISQDIKNIKIY